jgi:hypothetical protein
LTIGQLMRALFDWRAVNRFEMIARQNAFDGLRSRRALHSCRDTATKTTAVDKRGDLADMRVMMHIACLVSAGGADRCRKPTGLTLPPGYVHAHGVLAKARDGSHRAGLAAAGFVRGYRS